MIKIVSLFGNINISQHDYKNCDIFSTANLNFLFDKVVEVCDADEDKCTTWEELHTCEVIALFFI